VTIRATNYAGYADWNFIITVPNPPPTLLTNLTVISVTESSVTLSWDPESPGGWAGNLPRLSAALSFTIRKAAVPPFGIRRSAAAPRCPP